MNDSQCPALGPQMQLLELGEMQRKDDWVTQSCFNNLLFVFYLDFLNFYCSLDAQSYICLVFISIILSTIFNVSLTHCYYNLLIYLILLVLTKSFILKSYEILFYLHVPNKSTYIFTIQMNGIINSTVFFVYLKILDLSYVNLVQIFSILQTIPSVFQATPENTDLCILPLNLRENILTIKI